MGNCSSGGVGCKDEGGEFQGFRDTGGTVRVLIVALNYSYSKQPIVCIKDGESMQRMCGQAAVEDVTFMRDDVDPSNLLFPSKEHILPMMREIGRRCEPNDYFVWFYAGHGENVPDDPPSDEADGQDEAFVLPTSAGRAEFKRHEPWLIDDEFAAAVDRLIPVSCRVLCINDCCHSETICDVDSYRWRHQVISISACGDDEESIDTDKGGALTISIRKAMNDLALKRGNSEYSVETLYEQACQHLRDIPRALDFQSFHMQFANCDPSLTAWPMPHPWWKL
jgi:hypothetical protein